MFGAMRHIWVSSTEHPTGPYPEDSQEEGWRYGVSIACGCVVVVF